MSTETVVARDQTSKHLSPFNPKRNPPSPSESTISPPPSLVHQDTEADTESLTPTPGIMRLDPSQPVVFISNGSEEEIGCYLAKYFLRNNCKVILALPKPSDHEHHIINDLDCDKIHLNLRDQHSIDSVYEHIKARYTKIDVLIIPPTKDLIGPLVNLNLNNLKNLLDFNLIGNLSLIQKFSKLFILQKSGIIGFVTSGLGRWGTPWNEAFGLSMASLHSVIQTLKLELAPFNVSIMNFQINEVKSLVLSNNLRHLNVQNHYDPVKDYIYCSGVMSHSEVHHKLDNAASKIVLTIMSRLSGTHKLWHIIFLPLYYFIYLLALIIGYIIPDLVPHLKYFTMNNSIYPIYTTDYFVLEGWFKINLFSISNLLPTALKEWLVWDITGLGYINHPSPVVENPPATEEEYKAYIQQSNYSRTPRSSFSSFK